MVDRSSLQGPVILIADRGFESYNSMVHVQRKGWKYLIREVEHILQEIFARLIVYNFTELITSHAVVQKKTENMRIKLTFPLLYIFIGNSFVGMYLHLVLKLTFQGIFFPFAPVEVHLESSMKKSL